MATILSAALPNWNTPLLGQRLPKPTSSIPSCFSFSLRAPQNPMSLTIECSSRPRKKGTAHHNKTRPRKHSPSDKKRRGPTYYPPLPRPPQPMPTSSIESTAPPASDSSSIAAPQSQATPVVAEGL